MVIDIILTAIPNWTGRLPLSGWPLAGLVALWLAGRIACVLVAEPAAAMAVDLAFPALLAFAVWREVLAGKNWKNAPIAAMITLFGIANALHHGENFGVVPDGLGPRLALAAAAVLIALIGGRIVPSFTRNWLVKQGDPALPKPFGAIDKIAIGSTAGSGIAWTAAPYSLAAAVLLCVAGVLLLVRLSGWRAAATFQEPIVLIMHVGYAWLGLALLLLGVSGLAELVPETAALHALTAGAIGTMTLAVMTRASLGHAGRTIVADRVVVAIYWAVTLGAALRVAAPFAGNLYRETLVAGGAFWSTAFLLFAVRYAPILWGRRRGT